MRMASAGGDAESSDDDIEVVPNSVENYWLEDGDETPVSFADLPYFKTGKENLPSQVVYVRGTQDNGTRLYLRAVTWKLEFTKDMKPVFHLKTEKYWIMLKKPRKSFETTIRSILCAAMFLNYAFIKPGDPEKAAWNHVRNVYKSWDIAPNRDDLASHLLVIQHLVESNERLASSIALQIVRTGVSRKRSASARENAQQSNELHQYKYEKEPLYDEKGLENDGNDVDVDEVGDPDETVCCICDDGGEMICCDGPCMRSFHFKDASGGCSTLGLTKTEAHRMDKFFCPNCKFKRHQCFLCGELGCSDDAAGAAREVFVCGANRCGHFYHPSCVAKLVLKDKDTSDQDALAESIKEGKKFVCPVHNCWKCGKVEAKEVRNLQFGICRRCPRVWHRQCLPSSLLHDDPKRCWYGLLPNKILVYCNRHTIIPELATPARNHVKFPEGSMPPVHKRIVKGQAKEERKKSKPSKLGYLKKKAATSLKSPGGHTASKSLGIKRKSDSLLEQTKPEGHEPTKSKLNQSGMARDPCPAVDLVKERTPIDIPAKQVLLSQANEQRCNSQSEGISNLDAKLARTSAVVVKSAAPRKSASQSEDISNLDAKLARTSVVVAKSTTSAPHPLPQIKKDFVYKTSSSDKERESLVDDIIVGAKAPITIENVLTKYEVPANSTQYAKNQDRKHFLGKLESIIKGMGKAVETLENGGSIEDAKLHCPQDYISYIKSCSKDLELYLAPLLHDMSDAGHLSKQEKVKAIVDRLHWYLEDYDTIVDVTCGSDGFSSLLKKKLEESRKVCEYRIFDLAQANNDLNFSKGDWFEVKPSEFPDGDRLVFRLNLPMGDRAIQFIDHALTFRPKLIVLMVPKEVQKLDLKHGMYELVWEDPNLWEGHSSGSMDVQDNSLNGCDNALRLLYFWSRRDWTLKFKQIALDQGHIFALTSSHFTGSSTPPQPHLHSDFDMKTNCNNEAAVELGEEKKTADLGKSKYNRAQGELVIVNESPEGGEASSGLTKKKSNMLQVKDMTMKVPTGGQDTISNLDTSNASKLDQIMRRRAIFKCDGSEKDTQVNGKCSKRYKVETTIDCSKNDGFVPLKQHMIVKQEGVDSSIMEPSGCQSNSYSSQGSPERAKNSSNHGVFRKERKTDDNDICGDDKRNDDLVHDKHQEKTTSQKYLANSEADLKVKKSPDRPGIDEAGRRKLPDKYGTSRQEEDRAASPERSQHSCMLSEPGIESINKSCPSSVVDLGKKFVSKNVKNEDHVNPELPKPVSTHGSAAQYEFVNRNVCGQEAPSAQRAQGWDPLIRCNAQMPGHYSGAASTIIIRHSGLQLPYPPSGMQGINCSSNQFGTGHPSGSSGAGSVHFLPECQQSQQYFSPAAFTPSNSAPFYSPSQPVHLPPGYGSFQPQHYGHLPAGYGPFQPQHYGPLGFQHGFLPIQPQHPPFPESLPNQKNTGGWFED